jgi:hypothetical protein
VLGLPYKRPMPFGVNNCSLTSIDVSDDATRSRDERALLARLNDTCHLIVSTGVDVDAAV